MYMLGVRDNISIPVRVKTVRTVPNRFHGKPELSVVATLRLSPNADKDIDVLMWASVEDADSITVDEDFVNRDVKLEGHCPGDHENPYGRSYVGISAIWFTEDKLALVWDEYDPRMEG